MTNKNFHIKIELRDDYGWLTSDSKKLYLIEGWDDGTGGDGIPNVAFNSRIDLATKIVQLLRLEGWGDD